eukprot:3951296-Pleurochrysis_carterae.AAC.1
MLRPFSDYGKLAVRTQYLILPRTPRRGTSAHCASAPAAGEAAFSRQPQTLLAFSMPPSKIRLGTLPQHPSFLPFFQPLAKFTLAVLVESYIR